MSLGTMSGPELPDSDEVRFHRRAVACIVSEAAPAPCAVSPMAWPLHAGGAGCA